MTTIAITFVVATPPQKKMMAHCRYAIIFFFSNTEKKAMMTISCHRFLRYNTTIEENDDALSSFSSS
jgi:hypothetical protein